MQAVQCSLADTGGLEGWVDLVHMEWTTASQLTVGPEVHHHTGHSHQSIADSLFPACVRTLLRSTVFRLFLLLLLHHHSIHKYTRLEPSLSTTVRHASSCRPWPLAGPKVTGFRSSSTALSQMWLGLSWWSNQLIDWFWNERDTFETWVVAKKNGLRAIDFREVRPLAQFFKLDYRSSLWLLSSRQLLGAAIIRPSHSIVLLNSWLNFISCLLFVDQLLL